MTRVNLPSLTILRGPAALIVFVYHITHDTNWLPHKNIYSVGYLGVSLFFILSGFVLAWSFNPDQSYRQFYLRRFARVYPLHLLFLIVSCLVPVVAVSRTAVQFVPNLLLLQAWLPNWNDIFSYNAVSWSLSCEFFFYLLTPFILRKMAHTGRGKKASFVLVTWFIFCVLVGGYISRISNFWDVVTYSNPMIRSGEFMLGMFAAMWVKKINHQNSWWIAASPMLFLGSGFLTAISLLVLSHIGLNQTLGSFVATPFFLLLIISGSLYDLQNFSKKPSARELGFTEKFKSLLIYFGEISFAFYLVHELLIINLRSLLFSHVTGGLRGMSVTLLCLLLGVIIASFAHQFVEKPMQKIITAKFRGR